MEVCLNRDHNIATVLRLRSNSFAMHSDKCYYIFVLHHAPLWLNTHKKMILKCIQNWIKNFRGRGTRIHAQNKIQGPSSWDFSDHNVQTNTSNRTYKTKGMTLMGPPKQYFGDSIADRYAYMLYEAISLLHKNGFDTDVPVRPPTPKKRGLAPQEQVSGVLGYLLNDMDSCTQIAVFDSISNALVAKLGFTTYTQPWLRVVCMASDDTQNVDKIQQILSDRFLLTHLVHERKSLSLATLNKRMFAHMMTSIATRSSPRRSRPVEEGTITKFVFSSNNGKVLCQAIWSFANERMGTVGPVLDDLEIQAPIDDQAVLDVILSTMEDAIVRCFAPLVAFQIRVSSSVQDLGPLKWFTDRGYNEVKDDGTKLCKAFVMA